MKKIYFLLTVTSLLAACGGGGSDTPAAATAASTSPTPASTNVPAATPVPAVTPTATPVELVDMPVSTAKTNFSSGTTISQTGNDALWNVTMSGAMKLTVTGMMNKMWVSAPVAGGVATINGTTNTLVFLPGSNGTINVTGSGNTFYLVQGSPMTVEGPGAAVSKVIYYKPV